jgi:NADH dehydrogenase/putative oxidoreductase
MSVATVASAGRIAWGDLLGGAAQAVRSGERVLGPLLDVLIRWSLAQMFFVSAVLKLADWDRALDLARYEYPVSWLDPVTAAWLGVGVELAGGILLAAGLGARLAALALAALSLVIQFEYRALDAHLFWVALLGWIVARGAGSFSLDRMLAPGLGQSALPFARFTAKWLERFTKVAVPIHSLLLRSWIGLAVGCVAIGATSSSTVVPVASAETFAGAVAIVPVAMLVAGFGARIVAAVLAAGILTSAFASDMTTGTAACWFAAFALLAVHGAGPVAVDAVLSRWLARRFPQVAGKPAFALDGLPHVVIVGAGFGGIACAVRLARTPVRITLIDRQNYHLFQPLLYQVATTALSPGDIAIPIRSVFREQFNARVLLGEVSGVDTQRREVVVGDQRVGYDYLVLATGAAHSYFGRDEWAPFAPGLKRVEDATEVRRRILTAFERAEAAENGPTGVELAGAIAELARFGMTGEFRRIDPARARVVLVQAGPRILPTFPEALSARTSAALAKLGVEVLTDSRVERIDATGVMVNGRRIASRTVLWAAGVVASPAARWLGARQDAAGRLEVGADLLVPGFDNVFALGDTALSKAWNGGPVPGLAPAAKQGGAYVASVIRARVLRAPAPPPFRYIHLGSLATIGRKAAVADFGFIRLSGAAAWWLWGAIHVGFLVGVRNRVSVLFDWFWSYLTFSGATRLITGADAVKGYR